MKRPPRSFDTERLTIRAPALGDASILISAIEESIAELRRWMPWAQRPPNAEEQAAHLRQTRENWDADTDYPYFLFRRGTDEFVGGSGLHRFDRSVPRYEIGYWVRTSCIGQGYAAEAVRGITEVAFEALDAHRVEIRCSDANTRSWRVAERAGYELEGVLRNEARETDGRLRDTRVYALVR